MLVLLGVEKRMHTKTIITNSGEGKWYNIKGNKVKQIDKIEVRENGKNM